MPEEASKGPELYALLAKEAENYASTRGVITQFP